MIFPPLVTTAGEKARSFCVALPSRYCTEVEGAGCCGAETTLPPVRSPSPAPTIPTSPSAKRLNVGSPFLWNQLPYHLMRVMIALGLSRLHSDKEATIDLKAAAKAWKMPFTVKPIGGFGELRACRASIGFREDRLLPSPRTPPRTSDNHLASLLFSEHKYSAIFQSGLDS